MDRVIKLSVGRDAYDVREAMKCSMSVEELIAELENYPSDAKVVFSNDGGYTYGYIDEYRVSESEVETFEEEKERERKEKEEEEREELEETYRDIAKELCEDLGKTDADIEFCKNRLIEYANENNIDWCEVEKRCYLDSNAMFDYIYG